MTKYACKEAEKEGNAMLCDERIDDPNCPNYKDVGFPLVDKCGGKEIEPGKF